MKLWLDAQLSPSLAPWIQQQFDIETRAVRDVGLRDALDRDIFLTARRHDVIVMTKDGDFSLLVDQFGTPPQIIWLRCGNTSNARLRQLLARALPSALALLRSGEPLVEINDL